MYTACIGQHRLQVYKLKKLLACRDSVSPRQNVLLTLLFGLLKGGRQLTWLSVSDTGTHTELPSLMSKSTRRLPRCRCRPYTVNLTEETFIRTFRKISLNTVLHVA